MTINGGRMALGKCPTCKKLVFTGDSFDLVMIHWGADFPGDRPGKEALKYHRGCNPLANHRRDRAPGCPRVSASR